MLLSSNQEVRYRRIERTCCSHPCFLSLQRLIRHVFFFFFLFFFFTFLFLFFLLLFTSSSSFFSFRYNRHIIILVSGVQHNDLIFIYIYCEMITTISQVIIHHYGYNFFLVMRTFKIYSLSNFQIYNTVLLTIVIMLYITSSRLISITGSFYLSPPSTTLPFPQPSLPPLLTTNLFSVPVSLVFCFGFRFHI